jgi:DNA-binding NarL/FixJ family response regulator
MVRGKPPLDRHERADSSATPASGDDSASIRVAVVDDHHLVREGLLLVLGSESGIEIAGEAADWRSALELVERVRPDVMLLDITLPDADAPSRLRELHALQPDVRVVILTMHTDPETVRQALAAGASGYLVKGAQSLELIEAVRAVARGERYVHSSVTEAAVRKDPRRGAQPGQITPREREILILVASGHRVPDIAIQLGISVHTVRRHLGNVSSKVGVSGVVGLTRYALREGLVRDR